jgi:hypothetical protein
MQLLFFTFVFSRFETTTLKRSWFNKERRGKKRERGKRLEWKWEKINK